MIEATMGRECRRGRGLVGCGRKSGRMSMYVQDLSRQHGYGFDERALVTHKPQEPEVGIGFRPCAGESYLALSCKPLFLALRIRVMMHVGVVTRPRARDTPSLSLRQNAVNASTLSHCASPTSTAFTKI
jgi:hypothetical protein